MKNVNLVKLMRVVSLIVLTVMIRIIVLLMNTITMNKNALTHQFSILFAVAIVFVR